MLALALLKGLAQGYIVTAPAMLIMLLVGEEGTLGTVLSAGGVLSALVLYGVGRRTEPEHRIYVFASGLLLFAAGGLANAWLFDAAGVLLFMVCLMLAKPLLDLAYFPIQFQIIDRISLIEGRPQYAYILSHEYAEYAGRFLGCGLFLVLATQMSTTAALRYALAIIGILQLLSLRVAKGILESVPLQAGGLEHRPVLVQEPMESRG